MQIKHTVILAPRQVFNQANYKRLEALGFAVILQNSGDQVFILKLDSPTEEIPATVENDANTDR
jgi:hypothetical protein